MNINNLCPNCMTEYEGSMCPHCRHVRSDRQDNAHALKPYTILSGKYLVGNVIGEGGFGITYIGFDLNLEVKIAIKEYYPNGFVTRESEVTSMVTGYTTNDPEQFQKWKDSFVREARNLAKFSNLPGIVHVRDFFQENNTAYIIMEYVEGETLKTYLKNRRTPMTVEEVLELMEPVIKSLSKVHDGGIIHRDISPDNIMIQEGGDIKLIDFGAAREFEAGNEKSMSVLLKPGYAPEEQYRTRGEQGPWTDVYALCATIYRCITGIKPVESMERMRVDELKKPSEIGVNISPETENALMTGMAVYAESRIRDMNALHSALYKGVITAPKQQSNNTLSGSEAANTSHKNVTTRINPASGNGLGDLLSDGKIKVAAAVTVVLLLILLFVAVKGVNEKKADTSEIPTDTTAANGNSSDDEAEVPETEEQTAVPSEETEPDNKNPKKKDDDMKDEDESPMEDPLSDKDKYMAQYEKLVGDYWNKADHAGWDLIGLEIINLNADKSDVPEIVTLWDAGKGVVIGQTLFGLESSKDGKMITSSATIGDTLEIFQGDDGSTLAYKVNDEGTVYLVDSNEHKIFSFPEDDPWFECKVAGEYVGRVPDVMERASEYVVQNKYGTFYKLTSEDKDEVVDALIGDRARKDRHCIDYRINYSESGEEKDRDWEDAWNQAWENYEKYWLN